MSKFYGTVQGESSAASRQGHRGMHTKAASYAGAIAVDLRTNAKDEEVFEVRMEQHKGAGDYMVIATGKIGDAASVKLAHHHSSYTSSSDADLIRLAANAGATVSPTNGAAAFSVDELREFLRQAMAHEVLAQP
jgi:hypothetical protein